MNAQSTASGTWQQPDRLAGLGNFVRKEFSEWITTRRALWTAVAAQALILLGVLGMRIYATIQPNGEGLNLSPSFSMENAGWETVLPLLAVFSTMGMLVSEREGRTLAWSLSMPLTRDAVLLSKLLTAIAVLAITIVALPVVTTLLAVRLAYGDWPDAQSLTLPLLTGVAISFFLLILNLATSIFFRSQRSVVGIAVCFSLVIPGLIQTLSKAAVPWWPISIEFWIKGLGKNETVNWITPVVYAATIAGLFIVARWKFSRDDL
jgi:ABC-type transport system involved in multi-copper enzyme maturation permease subunit